MLPLRDPPAPTCPRTWGGCGSRDLQQSARPTEPQGALFDRYQTTALLTNYAACPEDKPVGVGPRLTLAGLPVNPLPRPPQALPASVPLPGHSS